MIAEAQDEPTVSEKVYDALAMHRQKTQIGATCKPKAGRTIWRGAVKSEERAQNVCLCLL